MNRETENPSQPESSLIRSTRVTRRKTQTIPQKKAESQSRPDGTLSVVTSTDPSLTAAREPKPFLQQGQTGMEQDKNTETKYRRDGIERFIRLYETWPRPDQLVE